MKKIIISTVALATLVFASNTNKNYEISPMVGQADTHDELKLGNDKSFGMTFAKNLDKNNYLDQIELGVFLTSKTEYSNTTDESDTATVLLSVVKEFEVLENTSIYGLVGVGYENVSSELYETDSRAVANYGLGIKYVYNNTIGIKAEARQVVRYSNENYVIHSLGIVMPFGEKETKMTPKPKVVEKAKPIVVGEKVDMSTNVIAHYSSDSAVLRSNDLEKIKFYAEYLAKFPNASIVVSGHTDSSASERHNESLAARRAISFKNELLSQGVNNNRIKVESYGETSPIASNDTAEGKQANRRVESKIIRSMSK